MSLQIKTKRLILRSWKEEDLEPFAQLNADPRVMEYFPSTMSTEESNRLAKLVQEKILATGSGFFAVSLLSTSEFIGFVGLNDVTQEKFPVHFTPATEIGWRLAYDHWNKGYASEAALACLKLAFETLDLQEIVAFTAEKNMRSQAVMKKIGMHWSSEDNFDNPSFPEGHPSRKNVLYRIKKQQWQKEKGSL